VESQIAVDSIVLSTCSEAEALGAADAFFGDPDRWEPSLIAYRLRSDFQADWKAEVGRWLVAAMDLGYIDHLTHKLERAFKDLKNPNRVSGANDSSHLILGQELAGAMTVYYFTRMGWKFVAWEPKLPEGVKGDVDVRLVCPHGIVTDVQIKAPDQPGEREEGQVVDGEYDERVLKGVDKGVEQLERVPGPRLNQSPRRQRRSPCPSRRVRPLREPSPRTCPRPAQPVLGLELGSMLAHDIGDVEARPPGGCRAVAHQSSTSFAHPLERALRFRKHGRAHPSVSRRRPNAVMPQQDLNHS